MGRKWTKEQEDAIKSRAENLLISASAGSGKTTVMIARIISLLKKKADLKKMLICTYTRASARDMKDKLYKGLSEELETCTEEEKKKIEEQMSILPVADISTIDSWCIKVVRNYFYILDIDPGFEIIDEKDSETMFNHCVDITLNEFLQKENNQDFLTLYDSLLEGRKDVKFKGIIKEIYNFAQVQVQPKQWLEGCLKLYNGDYADIVKARYEEKKRNLINEGDAIVKLLESKGFKEHKDKLASLISGFAHEEDLSNYKLAHKGIDLVTDGKMSAYKEKLTGFVKKGIPCCTPIETKYAQQIVDFVMKVTEKFDAEKDRKSLMSFLDCEHKAYEILQNPQVLAELKDRYVHVFVDEYQDVNPLQDAVISMLKPEKYEGDKEDEDKKENARTMFYVGDVKQSIYAFRNSDPSIFTSLYYDYAKHDFAKPIKFAKNYRCGEKIVDFVNEVFVPLMTKEFGGIDYSNNKLIFNDASGEGDIKITLFKPEQRKDRDVQKDYSIFDEDITPDIEMQADKIYQNIVEALEKAAIDIQNEKEEKERKRLENPGKQDDEEDSDESPFDRVAVLVKKRSDLITALYERLKKGKIPVHFSQDLYFTTNSAIKYIFDILTFIDNNENEIAFVSSVTSPYFKITAKELIVIKKEKKYQENFVRAARNYAKENSDELSQKLTYAFEFFDKYTEISLKTAVKDLVSAIIVELDYFNNLIALSRFEDANLLSEFLHSLVSCPYADTLYSYLKFIEDGGDKYKSQAKKGCVNIMTMHTSKGLEFSYVFIPETNDENKDNVSNRFCILDKNLGLAIKTLDEKEHLIETNTFHSLVADVLYQREQEEKARLLYVALTRAKKCLYLYAKVRETGKSFYDGYPVLTENFFGWMSEAITAHGYNVVDLKEYGEDDLTDNKLEINEEEVKVLTDKEDKGEQDDAELTKALKNRFSRMDEIYQNQERVGLKTSVTRVAGEEAESQVDILDEERKLPSQSNLDTAIKKGNAYHKTMELLDFSLPFEIAFEKVKNADILDFDLVIKDKIERCYNKIKPMLENAKVYKEKSFVYNDGNRLIQGIIDLFIIKDNKAIIIDYKTTSLYSLAQAKTLTEYKVQVGIYAKAVEEVLGENVEDVMLYSFEKDDFIVLS